MSNTEILVAVATTTALLMLNWRSLASHRLPPGRLVAMAAIWIGIIAAVAMLAGFFTT